MTEETGYRIVRNLNHNGSRFTPGQVVSGFEPEVASKLLASGAIAEIKADEPTEVLDANAKKPRATTVKQEGQAAPEAPANTPAAQTVTQQPAPAAQQTGLAASGEQLTPEQQAVRDTAAQIN